MKITFKVTLYSPSWARYATEITLLIRSISTRQVDSKWATKKSSKSFHSVRIHGSSARTFRRFSIYLRKPRLISLSQKLVHLPYLKKLCKEVPICCMMIRREDFRLARTFRASPLINSYSLNSQNHKRLPETKFSPFKVPLSMIKAFLPKIYYSNHSNRSSVH